ncbi:MAG: hypothetical protein EKK40_10410 [Bradyrhizobiaceae bacterium]|nr:MAG: hypothetical protein EKK40_10410 [Bradyrhizobiaceae bacterium]
MKRTIIAAQGEVRIYKIDALPTGMQTRKPELTKSGAAIISHSEQGHHHCVAGADVMERTDNVPAGMQVFYAIVKNATKLEQDAAVPHKSIPLEADSIYEMRVAREFDPFAEQARRVAD